MVSIVDEQAQADTAIHALVNPAQPRLKFLVDVGRILLREPDLAGLSLTLRHRLLRLPERLIVGNRNSGIVPLA